jgi:hypothetical protein
LDIINDDASGALHYVYMNDSGGTINATSTDYHWQSGKFGNGNEVLGEEGDGPRLGGVGPNESYHAVLNLSCIQHMVASYQTQLEIVAGSNIRCYIGGWEYEQTLPDNFTELRFYSDQASGWGVGTRIRIIDPTVAQTGSPSLYEDDEVRIPGEWWQDPNNTSDYYPKYRKVVDLGTLPNASSATTAHGITNYHLDSLSIYGHADNGTNVFPLPFVSEQNIGHGIRLSLEGANIKVDTGTVDRTSFTGYAILEYAKTTDTAVTRDQAYGNGSTGTTESSAQYSSNATLTRQLKQYVGLLPTTAAAAFQIDLPASPNTSDEVWVKDEESDASTYNITISGNGNNIDGSGTYTVNQDGEALVLKYVFSEWRVF